MKKYIISIVLMLIFIFPIISLADNESDEMKILFKDKNLYNAVVEQLQNSIESVDEETLTISITQEKLNKIKSLNLRERGIGDLTGVESFSNLEYLDLSKNEISSVEQLKDLKQLKVLSFYENKIVDLKPLSNLLELEQLYIWENDFTDVTPLSNLVNLELLNIGTNQVSDISSLSKLVNLKDLVINYTNISDLSVVKNFTNLNKLWAEGSQITDLSALSNLKNLTYLQIDNNKISDISPIENIRNASIIIKNQKISINVKEGEKILLPQIFIQAKDSNSIAYTAEEFTISNAKISEDGKELILDKDVKNAQVKINGGRLDGTVFEVTVEQKAQEPENKVDNTIANKILPKAGNQFSIVISISILIIIISAVILYKKMKF